MEYIKNDDGVLSLGVNDVPIESSVVFTPSSDAGPILELKQNGDIFVKGKLIENDKEVVDALREFLQTQGFINT
jgi:hypothetical protein